MENKPLNRIKVMLAERMVTNKDLTSFTELQWDVMRELWRG